MAIVPLETGHELIGLLLVDKEFTGHSMGRRDLLLLRMFCKQAALSIDQYQQHRRAERFERLSAINLG